MAERRKPQSAPELITQEHLPIFNQFQERFKKIHAVKGFVGQSFPNSLVIMIAVNSNSENTYDRIADIEYEVCRSNRDVPIVIDEWDMRHIDAHTFITTIAGINHDVASRLVTAVQARA